MDTGAERRSSLNVRNRSFQIDHQPSFSPLVELALALPWWIAHGTGSFLRWSARRIGRRRPRVGSMSGAWLIEHEVSCGKHGDIL